MKKTILVTLLSVLPLVCFGQDVVGSPPDNIVCNTNSDCEWVSGLPEKYGGCGCFNKDYLKVIRQHEDIDNGPIRQCEPPPNMGKPCVCIANWCKVNIEEQLLELSIKSDKEVYSVREEIKLSTFLKNKSEKEIVIFWNMGKAVCESDKIGIIVASVPLPAEYEIIYIKPHTVINKDVYVVNDLAPGKYRLTFQHTTSPYIEISIAFLSSQKLFEGFSISNSIVMQVADMNAGISKEEALKIAEEVCKKENWEWVEAGIFDRETHWEVRTHYLRKGGNASILIDKKTGKILDKVWGKM